MLRRAVAQPPIARVCQVLRSFAQLAAADCRVAFGLVLTVDRTGMGCYDRSVSMDPDGPLRPDLSVYAESCIVRVVCVCVLAGTVGSAAALSHRHWRKIALASLGPTHGSSGGREGFFFPQLFSCLRRVPRGVLSPPVRDLGVWGPESTRARV